MSRNSMKIHKEKVYELYFDDFCPLCLNTINFLNKFVKPSNTVFKPLSKAKLSSNIKEKALDEMLLILPDNSYLWGYFTYRKIFLLSSSRYKIIFNFVSILMKFPPINFIGKYIYKLVANARIRCDESCNLDQKF